MISNPFSRADSDDSGPQDDADEEDDGLTKGERIRYTFEGLPEVYRQLRTEWSQDRIQFYFLLYSVAASFIMLTLMLYNRTYVLIGVFVVYCVTALPLLYVYEEDQYFKPEHNPLLDENELAENVQTESSEQNSGE